MSASEWFLLAKWAFWTLAIFLAGIWVAREMINSHPGYWQVRGIVGDARKFALPWWVILASYALPSETRPQRLTDLEEHYERARKQGSLLAANLDLAEHMLSVLWCGAVDRLIFWRAKRKKHIQK